MSMTKKRSFKEIRQRVNELIKSPPTTEQLEDLKNTFVKIDKANEEAHRDDAENEPKRKIARDPEVGL